MQEGDHIGLGENVNICFSNCSYYKLSKNVYSFHSLKRNLAEILTKTY